MLTEIEFEKLRNKSVLTDEEKEILKPYKVDNAIIMAAGMSTRFVPFSYEKPKGLVTVKGEILVERLIRQLKQADINEIVLIVGYMKEKYAYLEEKFGVIIVENSEFAVKNNYASVYAARKYLGKTYIVSSDNYYSENPFNTYEYRALYCGIYLEGKHMERGMVFEDDGLIVRTNKPCENQWIMFGHAYFDNEFTNTFLPILEDYYLNRTGVENMFWENIYDENIDKLKMWLLKFDADAIKEFDSMEEIKEFEPDYLKHNKVMAIEDIVSELNCGYDDITEITARRKDSDDRSFTFNCKGNAYIYYRTVADDKSSHRIEKI